MKTRPRSVREEFIRGDNRDNDAEQNQAVILHEIAHADNEERDRRQRFIAQHIMKDRFELRHDVDK